MTPSIKVQLARLEARVDAHDELKADVKQILATVNSTNLKVAVLPTWEDVKTLHTETRATVNGVSARMDEYDALKNQAKGGGKTLVLIGTIAGTVGGWLTSWISSKHP